MQGPGCERAKLAIEGKCCYKIQGSILNGDSFASIIHFQTVKQLENIVIYTCDYRHILVPLMGCLASRPAQKEQESHHVMVRKPLSHGLQAARATCRWWKLLRVLQVDPAPPTHTQQPDGRAADVEADAEAGVMAAKIAAVPDMVDMSADSRCKPWETPEGM